MRRLVLSMAAVGLVAFGTPASQAEPIPPGFASANVEWLANVPLHADTAGARIVGTHMYVADSRALTIYDISAPETPVPVGTVPLPEAPYFPQEDLDTNGKILIIGQSTPNPTGLLYTFDVSNPTLPKLLSTIAGGASHTVSCVLNCTWVYDSDGTIVDLREPTAPKLAGDWRKGTPLAKSAHDVTEVSPGFVLTSSNPLLYLDARHAAKPKLLAVGNPGDKRFIHANLWPNKGTDRMLLVGGETEGTQCSDKAAGAFTTWDATKWRTTHTFKKIDEYRAPDGLPTSGAFPVETWCSHWFSPRPGYRNGGVVAVGWYEHGTRFLKVSGKGKISEIGWFIPAGTTASAAYWVGKDLLYLLDYNRGLDIIKFHDKPGAWRTPSAGRGLLPTQAPLFGVRLRPLFNGVCQVPVGRAEAAAPQRRGSAGSSAG